MKSYQRTIALLAILATTSIAGMLCSCEKAESMFSTYRAYFRYDPVSAKPNLYRACTSLGEFCSITFPPGANFVVKSPSTPSVVDYIQRTALQGYKGYVLGIGGGLIVGIPMIPEMLEQENQITCYDLCCPNCYQEYSIQKHMELHVGGISTCTSCQRSYDLNNQGIVAKGNGGRSLFRYYVHYYAPNQTLVVDNK